MSSSNFKSTSFYLSQWANNTEEKPVRTRKKIELEVVEDPSARKVCNGNSCSLYYDTKNSGYVPTGSCSRSTLCTETRIIKDSLFLKEGNVSNTLNSVHYDHQLHNW